MPRDYLDSDDAYSDLMEEHGHQFFSVVQRTKYPRTYAALLGFAIKTDSLKSAMFDVVESANPYAFNALFRCFCDHYLKFTYVLIRFLKESSDDVGTDYFSVCGAAETADYLDAIAASERLIGNEARVGIEQTVQKLFPSITAMTRKQLANASAKFRYRAVIRFLAEEAPELVSKQHRFSHPLIPPTHSCHPSYMADLGRTGK